VARVGRPAGGDGELVFGLRRRGGLVMAIGGGSNAGAVEVVASWCLGGVASDVLRRSGGAAVRR